MRYMITDEMWAVIEECLAQAKIEKRGRPAEISDRDFLGGLALPGVNGDSLARLAQGIWEMGCDLQPVSSLAQKRYAAEAF
jgi:transposase